MPAPRWVEFDPDDASLRRDFEDAYLQANVKDLPLGGFEAARRVALVLQRKRPQALIIQNLGPHWIVGDPEGAERA